MGVEILIASHLFGQKAKQQIKILYECGQRVGGETVTQSNFITAYVILFV